MPHLIDGVIDRRILLDISVGSRNIGLGLVIIVVGDEILNRIVGKQLAKFAEQLRRQGLVRGHDQGRPLHPGHNLGHGKGLARPGDAEQDLFAHPGLDIRRQTLNGRRLITGRSEVRNNFKGLFAAEQGSLHG